MLYLYQANYFSGSMDQDDYYITEEGYKCYTEKYHLKRGYCCQSNCRHCPYGFDPYTNTN